MNFESVKKVMNDGSPLLLDVGNRDEFKQMRIPNSVNLPSK